MLGLMGFLLKDTSLKNKLKMATNTDLKLCTYNCRSLKNCLVDMLTLCDRHDIILIQEHWLLPFELGILNMIHDDFLAQGTSAVDLSKGLLIGRPYGGTAILYRKSLASSIAIVQCDDPRVTVIKLNMSTGPVLISALHDSVASADAPPDIALQAAEGRSNSSSHTSTVMEAIPSTVRTSRKRMSNISLRKKESPKKLRNSGQQYMRNDGSLTQAKSLGSHCSCRKVHDLSDPRSLSETL